jgi:hypothetical protein
MIFLYNKARSDTREKFINGILKLKLVPQLTSPETGVS